MPIWWGFRMGLEKLLGAYGVGTKQELQDIQAALPPWKSHMLGYSFAFGEVGTNLLLSNAYQSDAFALGLNLVGVPLALDMACRILYWGADFFQALFNAEKPALHVWQQPGLIGLVRSLYSPRKEGAATESSPRTKAE